MAIQLEQSTGTGVAGVKFNQPGDVLVGIIVKVDTPDRKRFGTGEVVMKIDPRTKLPTNEPQKKTVLTMIVTDGTKGVTVKATDDDGNYLKDDHGNPVYRPAQVGDVVARHIEGGKRWDYFQAKKAANIRAHECGDVIREIYREDTMIGRNGERLNQAKHVHTYDLRRGKPEEISKAETKYHEVKNAITLEESGYDERPTSNGPNWDEEPF